MADSNAATPFTCTTDALNKRVSLGFAARPDQTRTWPISSNDTFVMDIKVLNVVLRSTYTRTLTDDEIDREAIAHNEAMQKIFDATHGTLVPECDGG